MRTLLDRFYDYVKSPEGFNCVEFQYEGITYQVVAGANISYVDSQGRKHRKPSGKNNLCNEDRCCGK